LAGRAPGDKVSGLRFDEILPGNYDGAAHVADMDLDGIDVSVVYPGSAIFVYMEPDAELALAAAEGARAGFIPGFPARPYHDGYYDPLWAAAAGAGLPLTFHRTFG